MGDRAKGVGHHLRQPYLICTRNFISGAAQARGTSCAFGAVSLWSCYLARPLWASFRLLPYKVLCVVLAALQGQFEIISNVQLKSEVLEQHFRVFMLCLRHLAVLLYGDGALTSDTDRVLYNTAAAAELCERALLNVKQSPSLTNGELGGEEACRQAQNR